MIDEFNEIKEMLNQRKSMNAKKKLDEYGQVIEEKLDRLEKLEKFFNDIKTEIRNAGKSNFLMKNDVVNLVREVEIKKDG